MSHKLIIFLLSLSLLPVSAFAVQNCDKFDALYNEAKSGSKKITKTRDEMGASCERFLEVKNSETGEVCIKQRQYEETDVEPTCSKSKIIAEYCTCK